MPLIAEDNGTLVWPEEVPHDATVNCPECTQEMYVRREHRTHDGVFKPRHFAHYPENPVGGHCSGGESDTHKLMKYVVRQNLEYNFEQAEVTTELKIPGTDRRGDVVLTFEDGLFPFGKGIVAEVQYHHDDKAIQDVTMDYLRAGYSVYWVSEDHFGTDYSTVELPDLVHAWPNGVPTPGEWSGDSTGIQTITSLEPQRHKLPIRLPPDCLQQYKEDLRIAWEKGSGNIDYSVVRRLTENNASRACGECGQDADYYFFRQGAGGFSRCMTHLPSGFDSN